MRVALVSTSAVPVPPKAYGGTELVVTSLARGLTRRGHAVTVYATGESRPEAELRFLLKRAVWPPSEEAELEHAAFTWRSIQQDDHFDVVHIHTSAALRTAPAPERIGPAVAFTIHHERCEDLVQLYRRFHHRVSFVAISRRQAELLPELRIRTVIHHGIDASQFPLGSGRGGYCAFLGRFAREKGVHTAIDAAVAAGVPLRIGAPRPSNDVERYRTYFAKEVRPRLDRHRSCKWLGELDHRGKVDLIANARALLFPIAWEEPFGLVMIESMMCGTPVLAFGGGSVPEVVLPGATGHIVSTPHEMARKLRSIRDLDRVRCREHAVEAFHEKNMVDAYESLYADLIAERTRTQFARAVGDE